MVIITMADGRVIKIPAIDYDLRVLTFEDSAYKGSASNAATYWSDLIADSEYGNGNGRNAWWDEDNTELSFTPSATALFPGYGGHAVSNYVGDDLSQGDYMHDLQAYAVDGGANGSKNFCVHFGYIDDSGMGMMNELVGFEFEDGAERVIDHMWVTNTTYVYSLLAIHLVSFLPILLCMHLFQNIPLHQLQKIHQNLIIYIRQNDISLNLYLYDIHSQS